MHCPVHSCNFAPSEIDKTCKMPPKRQICCDPLKIHKRYIYKTLRPVSDKLVRLVNDPRLAIGDVLCTNCRNRLEADPHSLPPQEEVASSSEGASSSRSIEEAAPSRSTESSVSDAEISRKEADQVMPILGISPLLPRSKYLHTCYNAIFQRIVFYFVFRYVGSLRCQKVVMILLCYVFMCDVCREVRMRAEVGEETSLHWTEI